MTMRQIYEMLGYKHPAVFAEQVWKGWEKGDLFEDRITGRTTYIVIEAVARAIRGQKEIVVFYTRSKTRERMVGLLRHLCNCRTIISRRTYPRISSCRILGGGEVMRPAIESRFHNSINVIDHDEYFPLLPTYKKIPPVEQMPLDLREWYRELHSHQVSRLLSVLDARAQQQTALHQYRANILEDALYI